MDFNLIANASRGPARAASAGDAVRGVASAARMALSLQALLPVVEAQGAQTQFARDLRALMVDATRGGTVFVVQAAGSSQLRIDIGRQFLTVPPTLRDAVMALLEEQSRGASTAGRAAPGAPAPAAVPAPVVVPGATVTAGAIAWAQAWAAGQQIGASITAALPKLARATGAATPQSRAATVDADGVLLDAAGLGTSSAATRLRGAVESSGLFFESHLAQWAAGTRSAESLSGELARMPRETSTLLADDGSRARTGVAPASGERVAAQLDVMQRSAFALNATAWPGQPVTIELRKELPADRQARDAFHDEPGAVFAATMTLELPRFGPLEVHLRLSGASVAVTTVARPDSRAQLADSLAALGGALQARGLKPVALRVKDAA